MSEVRPDPLSLLNQNRYQEAVPILMQAVQLEPKDHRHFFLLGVAYQHLACDIEAAAMYRKAISIAPDIGDAGTNLGLLLLIHGNPTGATKWFERTSGLPAIVGHSKFLLPDIGGLSFSKGLESAPARTALAVRLQELGRFDEAEKILRDLTSEEPAFGPAYYILIHGSKTTDKHLPIISQMESQLELPDLDIEMQISIEFALGKAYDDLGQYHNAIQHFDRANENCLKRMDREFVSHSRGSAAKLTAELIQVFGEELFRNRRFHGSDSELPVFIVGMPRSGTTVVDQILSCHPQFASGEECGFWRDNGLRVAFHGMINQQEISRLAREYLSLRSPLAGGKARLSDKMPQNFPALGIIQLALPNARIINVNRHPIDNALSLYMTQFRFPMWFTHSREELVHTFRQYDKIMSHWRKVLPKDRLLDVQYESLVSDSGAVVRRLLGFCGLDWNEACLHPERNPHAVKTASIWQARQPIFTSSVGKWRNYEPWLGCLSELGSET